MRLSSEFKQYYRHIASILLTLISTSAFYFIVFGFFLERIHEPRQVSENVQRLVTCLEILMYVYFLHSFHANRIGIARKAYLLASQVFSLLATDMIIFLLWAGIEGDLRFILRFGPYFLLLFILQTIIVCFVQIVLIDLYWKLFPPLRLCELHGDYSNDLVQRINGVKNKYIVEKQVYYKDADLDGLISEYDAVLLNDIPAQVENDILKYCYTHNKRVYFVPKISDIIVKTSEELNVIDTPLYLCRNTVSSRLTLAVKRLCDIVLSVIALILLSPVFAVTAIAIKREDGGPVFFRQQRCTIGGKKFMIWKFRSMTVDAEKDGKPRPAGEDDPRITKVGKRIRSARIDELPQFINILAGDMSLVGPRPERVEHVVQYTKEIPEFMLRSRVKGGLTGYAQVYGKYNTSALDKLKLDLEYIRHFSLILDLEIIIETLKILFQKDRTEGFSEERIDQMHNAE